MAARVSEPRVRVAAVIPLPGGILFVRQGTPQRPYHLLPGGGVHAEETLAEALAREVEEETGLLVDPLRPLFINDSIAPDGARHIVNVTFLARVRPGSPSTPAAADPAILGLDIIAPDDLGGLDLRPPLGAALAEAASASYDVSARYLGPLWTEDLR